MPLHNLVLAVAIYLVLTLQDAHVADKGALGVRLEFTHLFFVFQWKNSDFAPKTTDDHQFILDSLYLIESDLAEHNQFYYSGSLYVEQYHQATWNADQDLIPITKEFNSEDWGWRELKREVDSLVLF